MIRRSIQSWCHYHRHHQHQHNQLVLSSIFSNQQNHLLAIFRSFGQNIDENGGSKKMNNNTGNNRKIITFLTDVEGDKNYLQRFVRHSKLLDWRLDSSGTPYIGFLDRDAHFVYGGDLWDKGGHDLYVIRTLLTFKQRYPHRVHFIMGNRDINKIRIWQELLPSVVSHQQHLQQHLHRGVYWLKGTGRIGDPSQPPNVPSDPPQRLQWILANTMGSPDAFQHRKQELIEQQQQHNTNTTIDDHDVVQSYLESTHPVQGEMGQYLRQAKLVVRIGNAIFLHGSLLSIVDHALLQSQQSLNSSLDDHLWSDFRFAMPWCPNDNNSTTTMTTKPIQSVSQWLQSLDHFVNQQLQNWETDVVQNLNQGNFPKQDQPPWSTVGGFHYWPKYSNPKNNKKLLTNPSYGPLMQYGMASLPNKQRVPTVVYSSWLLDGGIPFGTTQPQIYQRAISQFMEKAGNSEVIVTGHQPNGDMPMAIRVSQTQFIWSCDSSYSGDTMWHHQQNRTNPGKRGGRSHLAISELLIELHGDRVVHMHTHGVLSDGTPYETIDPRNSSTAGLLAPASLVPSESSGKANNQDNEYDDGKPLWWTKAELRDGSHVLTHTQGFAVTNAIV